MAPTVPIEYTWQKESIQLPKKALCKVMGKSTGIVGNYRHAVETMAESEGFGSSGRLDTEMTASEDSCAPKRKSINLNNRDSRDRFGVPIQVLSLSEMSRSERKELDMRLRNELEHVRILQRRISSLSSNSVVLSPASDIHSCTDGQKRPPIETIPVSVKGVPGPPGKKKVPRGRNGPRTKGAGAKRTEPVKQNVPCNSNNFLLMKQCEALLSRMMSHEYGWVFNTPVDVVTLNIPDYFNVIKHPMDLGTIKSKLQAGEYSDPLGFAADVRLTFTNAMTYNPAGNDVHFMAKTLSKFFEMRWKPIEKKIPASMEDIVAPKSSVMVETEAATPMPSLKKSKITSLENIVKSENKVKEEPVKRAMSDIEKHKLSSELESLLSDLPGNIIDFLKESSFNASQASEDEIEIDLDALNDDTLFKLQKLLDDYLRDKQIKQDEPRELEAPNESGLSNSFLPAQKGNDPADEGIDIGGNDPPAASFPLVEIEKDARRNSKCSSSSSSSSESGSSSSDLDSGSSSVGELDVPKESNPAVTSKDTSVSGEHFGQQKGDPADQDAGDTINVLTGQLPESISVSVEPDGREEAGSAPLERQVSPEKLYRAALLRSRFADTIIKAQEKTLEKGEKLDPEKLRIEREELERRRREEKARLQAEAKAAEEARRKAGEEAAAEARRKIELEREAARLALQKMEKTVDINENSQFMEDLEMFRSVPDTHIPSFVEERSPDHSENGLGSFKFQGSCNPLEQLGLYMKIDDEDEEEPEAQSAEDASNDPEEGEID